MSRCNFCGKLFKTKLDNSTIFEQLACPDCAKHILKSHIKLGIGILHYKEDADTILKSLISIDKQKNFDFSNLSVIIVTDEGGLKLDENYINSRLKNFTPLYFGRKRTPGSCGCGGNRNSIIQYLNTDYVMFIDSDDRLHSNKVLHRIYTKLNKLKPDIYCSAMNEELYNGKMLKHKDLMCLSMTHGKVFKRDIFSKYNIWFDETIKVGEDLVCLMQLYNVCNKIHFDHNFITYDWLFNFKSITRNTGIDYRLETFYRCFDYTMSDLNNWYQQIIDGKNKFSNSKIITMLYNIFYYYIVLNKDVVVRETYLKKLFEYVVFPVDFELSDKLDKSLNRKLLKRIPYFREAYKKYKGN